MSLQIGEQEAAELDHDREQGDAVTTSLEHADEYIYEPLPGDRWIRVLILEPASELDCPLVARLELLSLGSALPMAPKQQSKWHATVNEKQQREAYVSLVNARRLPFTAVSYSWAMDDGDDSPCRELVLHGKQVSIAQNLSEGLRRIRLESDSQRLWVDALCIDQQNIPERSAQVAMMADIFKLAKGCIVWLGEGPTLESDLAVWQLSHCISPDLDIKAMPYDPGSIHEIAVIVLKAMLTVDNSRCTVHICNGHHPLLENAAFADNMLTRLVRGRYPRSLPSLHYRLYLKFMLRSHSITVKRKLSMINVWLNRRYWRRRWIVQELASRDHPPGATDYYWGKFSLSRKRVQEMLRILSIVVGCSHNLLNRSFDRLFLRGPLDVMQAGAQQFADLCNHLVVHNELGCSDARDRLYSLVTLDPDYGVRVDYTLSIREVCIEFSKLMVRRGDCSRLLRAQTRNRPRENSLDLPSWAIDLRRHGNFGRKDEYDQSGNAVVDASLQLSVKLNFIGLVADIEQNPRFNTKRYLVVERHGVRLNFGRHRSRKRSNSAQPKVFLEVDGENSCKNGDVLYANDSGHWNNCFLWLRPVNNEPPLQHRIIHVFSSSRLCSSINGDVQYLRTTEYKLPEGSRKTVHII